MIGIKIKRTLRGTRAMDGNDGSGDILSEAGGGGGSCDEGTGGGSDAGTGGGVCAGTTGDDEVACSGDDGVDDAVTAHLPSTVAFSLENKQQLFFYKNILF